MLVPVELAFQDAEPDHDVVDLVARGAGQPFHSGGRLMREWVLLQPADEAACAARVDEARAFVGATSTPSGRRAVRSRSSS